MHNSEHKAQKNEHQKLHFTLRGDGKFGVFEGLVGVKGG
jgi:hypothetical protein